MVGWLDRRSRSHRIATTRRHPATGRHSSDPRLRLLISTLAGTLHLLMNERVIHRHAPAGRHGGGLLVGSRRDCGKAKFLGQAGRELLMRRKSPRLLLGAKPFLRLRILAVINRQFDQPQFRAQGQGPAFALAQGGKPRRSGRRVLAAVVRAAGGLIPGIRPPLHVRRRPTSARRSATVDAFSWQLFMLAFCR